MSTLQSRLLQATRALVVLSALTVLSGGLVAGLKAGHAYPTFPLIAGRLVPEGLLAAQPSWRNFLDNALTVQFQHRVLGALVLALVIGLWVNARRTGMCRRARVAFDLVLAIALLQVGLGIATLLLRVPVALAAAHQGNAALLFATILYAAYAIRRFEGVTDVALAPRSEARSPALVQD